MLIPVLLSGGAGTRLWPLSRELYPKQLLPLVDKETMLQETARRADGLSAAAPVVVCNEEHRFLVAEQLRVIGHSAQAILLEPVGRNTAPAIAIAALQATRDGRSDPLLLVLPADHVIRDVAAFHAARGRRAARGRGRRTRHLRHGARQARKPATATSVAVLPRRQCRGCASHRRLRREARCRARRAVPRQRRATAGTAACSCSAPSRYLAELGKHAPDILAACRKAVDGAKHDLDFTRVDKAAFREPAAASRSTTR